MHRTGIELQIYSFLLLNVNKVTENSDLKKKEFFVLKHVDLTNKQCWTSASGSTAADAVSAWRLSDIRL